MKLKKKAILVTIVTALMLYSASCCHKEESINIIPEPLSLTEKRGHFEINNRTKIIINNDNDELKHSIKLFGKIIKNSASIELPVIISDSPTDNSIFINVNDSLNDEAYQLSVSKKNIIISAKGDRGIFYAFQTLRQLLPADIERKNNKVKIKELLIPALEIQDEPRFSWRGINVDVTRHFFSKEDLKKFIDVIAYYKLNILHLHLADDQGWRIEIKKYPELTSRGAWRSTDYYLENECKKYSGPYLNLDEKLIREVDGKKVYGGYYTQEEMKEIIAYALERKINILPEIDMPAHSGMAISIFPRLNCESPGPICPCNDFAYEFARNVFSEIIEVFPCEYIHLGCDEVDRSGWKKSKTCERFMEKNAIEGVEQLQSFFTREMEKFFNSRGRKLIGWDEILEGGISETATAMYWRTWIPNNLNNLLSYGNNVVIATTTYTYFDLQQNSLSLEHTYGNKPVPEELKKSEKDRIIGIHASLWSEVIPNVSRLEYMAFPRAIAFAETAWSAGEGRRWDGFSQRMSSHYRRLDAMNVRYRLPDLTGFIDRNVFVDEGKLVINQPLKGTVVRYTTDGSVPDASSPLYRSPVKFNQPASFNISYFRPNGELFDMYRAEFLKEEKYMEPAHAAPEGSGLIRKYYKENFNSENLKSEDISKSIELPERLDNHFGLLLSGYIKIKQTGIYSFYLTSDDGSILKINDQIIIDNGGSHKTIQKSGQAALQKGYHKFELSYLETGFDVKLQLHYGFNGNGMNEIEEEMLFH